MKVRTIAALFLLGCGSPALQTVIVFPEGDVAVENGPSAKAREVKRQIDALVGHSVGVEMDDLLSTRLSGSESVATVLLGLAGELGRLKQSHPATFLRATQDLKRVHYVYSAIARRTTVELAGGTMRVKVADGDACACNDLGDALVHEHRQADEARMASFSASNAPEKDLYAFASLRARTYRIAREPTAVTEADVRAFDEWETIHQRSMKLAPKERRLLSALVYSRLQETGESLLAAYRDKSSEVARQPEAGAFRALERKYVAFLGNGVWSAPEPGRTAMLKAAIGTGPSWPALRGFDRASVANRILDAWVRAGTPSPRGRGRESSSGRKNAGNADSGDASDIAGLAETFLCPSERREDGQLQSTGRCERGLLDYLRADPSRTSAFVTRVAESAAASELLFSSLIRTENQAATWALFEANEASWQVVTRILVRDLGRESSEEMFEETLRIWRKYPARRALAAVVLGSLDRLVNGAFEARIRVFAREGNLLREADFGRYLDEGPFAFERIGPIWPLLGSEFSRVAVIGAHWDRTLSTYTRDGLVDLRSRICDDSFEGTFTREKAVRDLQALAGSLETWARAHPGTEQIYHDHVEVLRAEQCKPRLADLKRLEDVRRKRDAEEARRRTVVIP